LSIVGIIANPASGKDIRRLVAFGSSFDNQEKVRIVRRVLLGLAAMGVDRITYMQDYFGIVERARERMPHPMEGAPVPFKPTHSQEDSTRAGRMMADRKVACIITLGGDGTNRAVAKGCGDTPILPISTGTNNVFPTMVEGTIAGLAASLLATNRLSLEEAACSTTSLEVFKNGKPFDMALVDAAVYDDPFVGSRAIWEMGKVRQLFLNRAEPTSIGLSAIGGVFCSIAPDDPLGLCLGLGENGRSVFAPIAPGTIVEVKIEECRSFESGEEIPVTCSPSVLALDGEREIDIRKGERFSLRLNLDGPVVMDAHKAMQSAMKKRLLAPDMPDDYSRISEANLFAKKNDKC